MRHLHLRIAALLALATSAMPASASPVYNDQTGIAVEIFDNLLAIESAPGLTFNIDWDVWSQSVSPLNAAAPAQLTTKAFTPASVAGWGEVRVAAQVTSLAELGVDVLDAAGNLLQTLTLTPSAAAGWDFAAAINPALVNAVAHPSLRLRVHLDGSSAPFAPVLERIGITWEPLSVIALNASGTATACADGTISYTVPVSVSRVGATRLGVKLTKPLAQNVPTFVTNTDTTFKTATQGGRVHSGASIVIGDLTVNAGDVYWDLNPGGTPVAAGTTFVLTASFGVPKGLVDGATYRTRASADATNAAAVATTDVVTAVQATPAPATSITFSGVYRIFNKDWAEPNSNLTGEVWVENSYGACRQTYHRAVVAHDLSAFYAFSPSAIAAGPSAISDGGVFLPAGTTSTFYSAEANPVVLTGPKIVWTLDALGVGDGRTLTWNFTLAGTSPGPLSSDDVIPSNAIVRSAYDSETAGAHHDLYIDVPAEPSGVFAIGNSYATGTEIVAASNDLASLTLSSGDTVGFPMSATNTGASKLMGVWMFQRIEPGTSFVSASAPSGTTLWYNTNPAGAGANPAVPFEAAWNPGNQTYNFSPNWTTTAPAAGGAYWIMSRTPALASGFFPEPGVPKSVTVNVTVRVVPPSASCVESTLVGYLVYDVEKYLPFGDSTALLYPQVGIFGGGNPDFGGPANGKTDMETALVADVLPGFEKSTLTGTEIREGSGPVEYTLNIVNDSGTTRTDMAAPVDLVITFPEVSINGVMRYLALVDFDVGSGVVTDLSAAGDSMTVHWDVLPAGANEAINLGFLWPRGAVDGAQAILSATVVGEDDYCGTVDKDLSLTTVYSGTPALRLSKTVNLAAVGVGDEIEYRLRALNYSDTASERTVTFDRVPDNTAFVRGLPLSPGGEFWFSNALPPTLPDRLNDPLAITSALLDSGLFVRGIQDVNGNWTSSVANPTWIAVTLDAGTPAQLGAGVEREFRFVAQVISGEPGTVIANRGLVDADLVLGAISATARTIITDEPYVTVNRACGDVVSSGETFSYAISFFNSSSANDDTVRLTETMPAGLTFVSSQITWNAEASEHSAVTVTPSVSGNDITWDITGAMSAAAGVTTPLESLEGATLTITVTAANGLTSGTYLDVGGVATATNVANTSGASFYSACSIIVSNPDITVRAFVDQSHPVGGDNIYLTVLVSNEDFHAADALGLSIQLPPELTLAGLVSNTNPTYGFSDGNALNVQPVGSGNTLAWLFPVRELVGPSGVNGRLEGDSGDITLRIPLLLTARHGARLPARHPGQRADHDRPGRQPPARRDHGRPAHPAAGSQPDRRRRRARPARRGRQRHRSLRQPVAAGIERLRPDHHPALRRIGARLAVGHALVRGPAGRRRGLLLRCAAQRGGTRLHRRRLARLGHLAGRSGRPGELHRVRNRAYRRPRRPD